MTGLIKGMKWPPRIAGLAPHDAFWYAFAKKRAEMIPLVLDDYHKFIMLKEWAFWKKHYLPPGGIAGKRVLDAGAGCGETAYFYFMNGARGVVAIEPDPVCAHDFRLNMLRHTWPAVLFQRKFEPKDLDLWTYDFVKMDIEGGEESILARDTLPPGVYEIHGTGLMWKFHDKFVGPIGSRGYPPSASWQRVNRHNWLLKISSSGA